MKHTLAAYEASRDFAVLMGHDPLMPVGTFIVRSKSRRGVGYEMLHTPEGYAVHQGEGCEGETFRGPLACWHSKDYSVTREETEDMTSVVPYESKVPERIDFTGEQLDTIAKVICVDQDGKVAPPQFVQLFIAACRHTGLDPFLKQIYAMNMRGKWTMFVGVDGYRVISERTKLDQGMDGPQWSDDGRDWFDFPPSEGAATYCRVAIWRKGVPRPFVAVLPLSARIQPTSDSWKKDPNGMLAKCCEVLARRRAFPADMAVLDNTVEFDASDGERPITRAEVPDGSWREVGQLPDGFGEQDGAKKQAQVDHERSILEEPQQAPVSASDGRGSDEPRSTPAAPSPEGPLATDEQLAKVAEWTEAIKAKPDAKTVTDAVDAARRAEYPYAIVNGRFSAAKLTEQHCAEYIAILADAAGGAAAQPEPAAAGLGI